ncbi:Uncharacterized membrane protein YhaH, DUF805 family [Kaistia soli DSM 19436]|uniref:Uncharacterized membrane protein YhaH, DUF805 family n=1 Tax=Kaistia soli DSM 19436 TaxID=1122133 RepID=A0A1M4X489_9HYPH|nr:DUF805 domain-containing protein [Kaistia soli]SHE88002.1 Uncharacterized membrane protein YhaH, DUF805 family [Kaistia soli DSM 19436]
MNMTTAVKTVFSKYVTFSGRAPRSEFWWWVLFTVIVSIIAYALDNAFGWDYDSMQSAGPLSGLWSLATILPNLAVTVRRLHDTDRSGWWIFLTLIPLIGALVLLYWYLKPGTPGTNRFG